MEIYESVKNKSNSTLTRTSGDYFKGLYYPYTINGKSKAFCHDFDYLLTQFINSARDLSIDSDLITLYYQLYKKLYFSKILIRLKVEDIEETWELLWGVWSELFTNPPKHVIESDIIYYKLGLIFTCFYLYYSQVPQKSLVSSEKIFLHIPIALDTFNKLLDFADHLLEQHNTPIAIELIHYLYRQGAFALSLVDGPQLGNPLKIN